jgi:TRAP-type transport system small permease protein
MRYVVGSPFGFTEEFVGLLFGALVFLALPYAALGDQHIRVDIITDRLPTRWRLRMRRVSYLLVLIFCIVFTANCLEFTVVSYQLDAKSDVARIALYPWMALMPTSTTLLGLILSIKLLQSFVKSENDHAADDPSSEPPRSGQGPLP